MSDFGEQEARKYLERADYPAGKEDLARSAEDNGAPGSFVAMIGRLGRPEYGSVEDVLAELRSFPTSG